jgi:hypothetical protein
MNWRPGPDDRDVVEGGQAECHKCGEWYHVTAPFIPHRCLGSRQDFRDALDALELAVIGLGLNEIVEGWGEPRHRGEIGVTLKTDAATVYQIYDAMAEATRLMNLPEQNAPEAATPDPEHLDRNPGLDANDPLGFGRFW